MAKSNGFVEYITQEILGHIPGISVRAMFGGYSVYKDGVIFGLIDDDRIYFKVDDSNRKDYEEAGSKPFTFRQKGKMMPTSYWEVPEEILENKDEVEKWLQKSVTASLNAKKKK
jgi:DNA transformation protein and related proteins